MKSVEELLKIDAKEAAEKIEKYIQDVVREHRVNGVIMGLSGGIDSALLATLAVRALGKDKVSVYFLHDKNSEKDSEDKARIVADWLGLNLNIGSIEARMREKAEDAPFFKIISALPPFAIPIMASIYYIIVGETPYMTTLRKNEFKRSAFKRWVYDHMVKSLEIMFDGPCEERKNVLEKIAGEKNMLLIGTGNRSEDLTGWFTMKGLDNMPVSPIKRLYKTEVRELSRYLEIPSAILKQVPSPDVLRGVNDTLALGMSFEKIDVVLYGIEHNMKDDDLAEYGLKKSEIDKVRRINRLSEWRRNQDIQVAVR